MEYTSGGKLLNIEVADAESLESRNSLGLDCSKNYFKFSFVNCDIMLK